MLNDSVREELASKISPIQKAEKSEAVKITLQVEAVQLPVLSKSMVADYPQTSEIMSKNTSPTLVEFNNKNATLPDWRLQLQNSVRRRLDNQKTDDSVPSVIQSTPHRINYLTNGATALKAEAEVENTPMCQSNPMLEKALRRIENSRKTYLITERPTEAPSTVKQFPRTFPNKSIDLLPKPEQAQVISNFAKPNLIQFSSEVQPEQFDTNKLPPLTKICSKFEKQPLEYKKIEFDFDDEDLLEIDNTNPAQVRSDGKTKTAENYEQSEEIEDCAPISLRFNAAIFDLLVGSFLSLVLLSPFMIMNGRFFSVEGFFAFLATSSIVMFIYLTTTIGFLGRTLGMYLFSLEIIDIEENDYPSLHQAAVSSSVYLISLGLGGIGFLTMLLNSEKRAAHDLLSKTIIVKEY